MNASDYRRFLTQAAIAKAENPSWRWGQAYYNTLHDKMPALAESIAGTDLDPFHRDDACEEFRMWLIGQEWDTRPEYSTPLQLAVAARTFVYSIGRANANLLRGNIAQLKEHSDALRALNAALLEDAMSRRDNG